MDLQQKYIASCTAAKQSTASCECVLAKFELQNLEKPLSIAELLTFEIPLRSGERMPSRVIRYAEECGLKNS